MSPDERPEPPHATDELGTLTGFLEFLRATLAWKTDGLDEAGLRATLPPSDMTLGGMLHHLAFVEDYWFGCRLAGEQPAPPWDAVDWDADPDWDWHAPATLDAATVRERWTAAVERSRRLLAEILADGDLGTLERREPARVSVRYVLTHMIEEYARHAGHADLLRQSIDGLVGE
ncbi:DinB family protein [Actinotalea caeni]|uniref:DinB family protein n=1 Tax=Actinotalea caeni TaxID=1348467 RepID=UPI0012E26670|nr:DinB family protein [Actinotalea caeni]